MNTKICPTCKNPIAANAPGGLCPACVLREADEQAPAGRGAPSLAEIAAAFPQLEIEKLIGQGGMGFVYKARQPSLDRTVALKILAPELGRDPAFAERFAREARVLGKLHHPNIVTVFETGQAGAFFYLLMEFVDGVNLRQAMRAGRFTPEQALAIVPGICDALQAAHAQGVWHRDIKPENILLDARGGVKIADFGIARIIGDPARDFTLTATGNALGSAPYMAPEQHERPHDVDHRADIYSLGVVIYEMLTGELPLGRFPAPSQRAAVSARIDEIVFQTLEKERELRQQSAAEVKTDVTRAEKSSASDHRPAATSQWTQRMVAQAAIVGGIALFVAAVGFTHGSAQGTLISLAAVPFMLGVAEFIFFRSNGEHRFFDPRCLPRWGKRLAIAAVVAICVIAILHFLRKEKSAAIAIARLRAEQAQHMLKLANAQRNAASPPVEPSRGVARTGNEPIPHAESEVPVEEISRKMQEQRRSERAAAQKNASPSPVQPPVTKSLAAAIPVDDVFRQLNAFANASDGVEFREHLSAASDGESFSGPIAVLMQVFLGKITILRPVPAEQAKPSPDRATLFAALEQRDGSKRYRTFRFRLEKGTWRYEDSDPPLYRTACRVEFRPETGDAFAILRTHVGEKVVTPVAGMAGQFDLVAESIDPGIAAADANQIADLAAHSLTNVGLASVFHIVAKAEIPTRPILAEETSSEEPHP